MIGIAGGVPLEQHTGLQHYFDVLIPVNNEITDIKTALENTEANLIRTGKLIGEMLAIQSLKSN